MSKPIVALIGRPNVGKSTFFNYIIGERKSIVEDTPGVTRDRIYADTEWRGRKFTIIDTGGIEPKSNDEILVQMKRQAQVAMETADVIIFLTDIKQGVTATDYEVATMLRKTGKPIVLVCNKTSVFLLKSNHFSPASVTSVLIKSLNASKFSKCCSPLTAPNLT